jgi:hypothetical protein
MSIVVTCPYCSQQASVDPQYAGHQVQCPHCGGVMVVPAAQAATSHYAHGAPEAPQFPAPNYTAPAAPQTFLCAGCGGMFVTSDGVDVGGGVYCHSCAAAVTPHSKPAHSKRITSAASRVAPASDSGPAFEVMERCDGCDGSFSATGLTLVGGRQLCPACAAVASKKSRRAPASAPPAQVEAPTAVASEAAAKAVLRQEVQPAYADASIFTGRKKKADYTGLIVAAVVVLAVSIGGLIYFTRKPADELVNKTTPTTKESTTTGAAPTASVSDSKLAAWEAANSREIRSLERLATGQVDRKDYASADQTFSRLIELSKSAPGGKGPNDAGLRALVDGAQRKWDAIKPNVPKPVAVSADTKAEIDRLLREADFAAKGGSKPAAFERYREALSLASGNTLKGLEPAMQQRIAEADKARHALFDELHGRKDAFDLTAQHLLDTGYAALNAGKWEAAFDTLWDVRLLAERRVKLNDRMRDEDYIRGAHGVAVAYIGLGAAGQAADMFDESQTLGIIAKEKPTKELLWNRGIFDIESKTRASRTVQALVAYLSKDESAVDEDLLNLLGTAIATAIAQPGEDLPALYKAADYYKKRNQQLEAAKGGGQMHWGINWLSQAEGAALTAKKEAAEKVYKQLNTQLETVKKKMAEVKRGEKTPIKRNGATIYVTRVNEDQLKAVQTEFDAKLKEVKAAHAEIPKAQWLTSIKPMIPGTGVVFGGKPATTATATAPTHRKFAKAAVAFPVDRYRLLTAAAPLGDRKQVRLEDMDGKSLTATVIAKDERLALLEVSPGDAGRGLKFFNFAIGYSGGPVTCATVPVPSAFGPAPEQVKAVKPQRPPTGGAATQPWVLELEDHPRLAGAPLLDSDNRVVGLVTARKDDPKDRTPAASLLDVQNFLAKSQALPEEETDQPAGPEGIYLVVIDLG